MDLCLGKVKYMYENNMQKNTKYSKYIRRIEKSLWRKSDGTTLYDFILYFKLANIRSNSI